MKIYFLYGICVTSKAKKRSPVILKSSFSSLLLYFPKELKGSYRSPFFSFPFKQEFANYL